MDEDYKEYLWKKIEVMANEYTTMSDEDRYDYMAFYIRQILSETTRES